VATSTTGLGLVYYDRLNGNLVQVRQLSGKWQAPIILDGATGGASPTDSGNVGSGASLFIDAKGDWHVSYVSLDTKSLRYMLVTAGTQPQTFEAVDDGSGVGGQAFSDGHHWLDDSNVTVGSNGVVRMAYQDGTSGGLRVAVGVAKSGGGHSWTTQAITQDGFAGFFPLQIGSATNGRLVNWWRKGGAKVEGDVRIVGMN
jgi:hypothetical protein